MRRTRRKGPRAYAWCSRASTDLRVAGSRRILSSMRDTSYSGSWELLIAWYLSPNLSSHKSLYHESLSEHL